MTRPEMSTSAKIAVMYSFDQPNEHSNPYVKLLIRSVEGQVDVRYFSWSQLFRRPPNVLHMHWPETMVRGSRPWRTWAKSLLGICYLLVRPLLGTKLVWTVHNSSPHENEGVLSSLFCRFAARSCDARIVINEMDARLGDPRRTTLVLHGTFSDWYRTVPEDSGPVDPAVRLLFVGLIRPYKGVPELVDAFCAARNQFHMKLTIRGAADDSTLRTLLQESSAGVPDLDLAFGHVNDEDLAALVGAADLVVLPYRRLRNSGAALLALSLGRAVLLPDVEVAQDLRREFGPEWVYLYDGGLTEESLLEQVRAFKADSRPGVPDMSSRQWSGAGRAHLLVYQELSRQPLRMPAP